MRTVEFQDNVVRLIDQTALPEHLRVIDCRTPDDVQRAIKTMQVRGAPAIGAAAAYGMALAALEYGPYPYHAGAMLGHIQEVAGRLKEARPTAVNLAWAVDRMRLVAERALNNSGDYDPDAVEAAKAAMLAEANAIADEDVRTNREIGAHGATLIPQRASILTHCNTGSLATVEYGTALGVIRSAHAGGKEIHVFVDETRPFLQGARLTAWELNQDGIPQTLISDNMAGHFMMRNAVDLVIVGADRIAANGDVANKIGTYTLAVLCKEHGLPFYVAAPTSTVDLSLDAGDGIKIDERSSDEVTHLAGQRIAPEGVKAAHPAFDVTPGRLVTAIITEQGVLRAPYEPALRAAVAAAEAARRSPEPQTEDARVRA
jgi:methylthioribose-1-phosphate isomerase